MDTRSSRIFGVPIFMGFLSFIVVFSKPSVEGLAPATDGVPSTAG